MLPINKAVTGVRKSGHALIMDFLERGSEKCTDSSENFKKAA